MNLLGRCYRELGMLDLAAKQLEEAAREILTMDPMKKEIVYNLGLVYEQMGDAEKSIDCMKQIYEVDYGYRDVAARVESVLRKSRARGSEAGVEPGTCASRARQFIRGKRAEFIGLSRPSRSDNAKSYCRDSGV